MNVEIVEVVAMLGVEVKSPALGLRQLLFSLVSRDPSDFFMIGVMGMIVPIDHM